MMARYGTPAPPSANALLEGAEVFTIRSPNTIDSRNSLLLDVSDDLGMKLLLSNATIDSQEFKILSLEEVERLKREKSLLDNRIQANTRKLALESKVRDASQNLVRLHANKNKRMSRQAEEQLENAARKVDDLATDLWRLQRRYATIKQQILEHTAAILARTMTEAELTETREAPHEFDESHLYRDSSLSYRDSSSSRTSPSILPPLPEIRTRFKDKAQSENDARAEAKLRKTNDQLQDFLHKHVEQAVLKDHGDNEDESARGSTFEVELFRLECRLSDLQNLLAKQKNQDTRRDNTQADFVSRLWRYLDEDGLIDHSTTSLEEVVMEQVQELDLLRKDAIESEARVADLEERHATAMKQLQAEYEKDLDEVHSEMDEFRCQSQAHAEEIANHQQHKGENARVLENYRNRTESLSADLLEAQARIDEVESEAAKAKLDAETQARIIHDLESSLSSMKHEAERDRESSETSLNGFASKVAELETVASKAYAEIAVYRDRLELYKLEAQAYELNKTADRTAFEAQFAELSHKQLDALQHSEQATDELTRLRKEHTAIIERSEKEIYALRAQVADLGTVTTSCDPIGQAQQLEKSAEHEVIVQELESEIMHLTMENSKLKVYKLQGEQSEPHKTPGIPSIAAETIVRELEAKVRSLEHELASVTQQNNDLQSGSSIMLQDRNTAAQSLAQNNVSQREKALADRCALLQDELDSMLLEYEAMTRSALFHETERSKADTRTDELVERVVLLESQIADERIKCLGLHPAIHRSSDGITTADPAGVPWSEPPTTATLRKEFRRLVQDMRSEHAAQTRADYTEIKRLERKLATFQGNAVAHGKQRA